MKKTCVHTGFKSYVGFLNRFRPAYLIHGHVHLRFPKQERLTVYRQTTVLNAYGYQVLEIDIPPNAVSDDTVTARLQSAGTNGVNRRRSTEWQTR